MKRTIPINSELHRRIKVAAAMRSQPMALLVESALRAALDEQEQQRPQERFQERKP